MKIGFVYDLRDEYRVLGMSDEQIAEFDTIETIDEIAAALSACGADVERIGHGRNLARRLALGERWTLVFSIAEGIKGRSREAQVAAVCEMFDQPYVFSDPLTLAVTLDKAVAKRLVRDTGVPTAPFAILERADDARRVALPFPMFVKPIAEGTGKGCEAASRVSSAAELSQIAAELIARFGQPAIAETYLPGREFTVGIVGTGTTARIIGVCEVLVQGGVDTVYSFNNKELCERFVTYRKAEDAEALAAGRVALAAYRALDCRDTARLDLRSDEMGMPQFLEANPLPGLHPTHSDLPILTALAGKTYPWLINEILTSACKRYGLRRGTRRRLKVLETAA